MSLFTTTLFVEQPWLHRVCKIPSLQLLYCLQHYLLSLEAFTFGIWHPSATEMQFFCYVLPLKSHSGTNASPKVFNKPACRPVQSISCNVCVYVCVSVYQPWKGVEWGLLVIEHIPEMQSEETIFFLEGWAINFFIFYFFWLLGSSLF